MVVKQIAGSNSAPDGSQYVTITDGAGNLVNNPGSGTQATSITDSTGASTVAVVVPGDAANNASNSLSVRSLNTVYNGTSWDRVRNISASSQTVSTGVPATALIPHGSVNSGITSTASSAATSAQVLKASAGNLFSICVNAGASAGYLMVFDATAAPADGAVTPVYSMPVAANAGFFTDFAYPIRCNTGITLVFSTTGPFTKTASATAFLSGQFI